ncbi:hypothetical protein N7462_010337 [Penicillium macrosclerotiorum]|uniref:uncharacterized protein n=1 Tax=Penicillium macrosclerotiorum TaxID=303699 RepID=UPI002547CC15|nr:uncharacterized protein N7462_010337 [Penicillium macrosclerotiorum]KAJ5669267.1 hypothetical protein N7462_010337 [Penicillium macrosclerotiorum]
MASYASPPLSPQHWADLDPRRSVWDSLMDGDQRMKQHERSMARAGNGRRATDRFEAMPRGDPSMSQGPDRAPLSYDYGYPGGSFHGSLQENEMQSYGEFVRSRPTHPQQPMPSPSTSRRRPPDTFVPYESAMLYGFGQQGPAPGSFDAVPQYPTRQSAVIEALSNPFAVPQYFTPDESTAPGVAGLSPYLNAPLPYNQPGPMPRPNTSHSFPATMAEFTSIGLSGRLDPPSQPEAPADSSSLEEAYAQYQRALRSTFDHTRAGRLVEASRSLLEISEWLVTNARDLGILRDDHLLYPDRLALWNDFNLCWLAVCQRQKDLTQDLAASQQPGQGTLLSRDRLEAMGKDLIQFCDQLEQHGLVDYQMGIWEEEILSVLGQCLDLMESRPDLLRLQAVPEPATTVPRP